MAVLTMVFLLSLMDLTQGAAPSKIMRTQMDVDYTGRVRQAPGANSIHVGRERHEVRDEEEHDPIEINEDEDEASGDWQARRVPNLGKPVLTQMTQSEIKKKDADIKSMEEDLIKQAVQIPWGNIVDDKDNFIHQSEDAMDKQLADTLANSEGIMKNVVDTAKAAKETVEKVVEAMPAVAMHATRPLQKMAAENIAGMHFPKLLRDVQDDIASGDARKALTDMQGGVDTLKDAPMDAVKELVEDPLKAAKVASDAAKLAEDVKNLQDVVKHQ